MKKSILTAITFLAMATPTMAIVDTSQTYNSGILVLLFVGFCALLIVAQLVPAVLVLIGATKAATKQSKAATVKH